MHTPSSRKTPSHFLLLLCTKGTASITLDLKDELHQLNLGDPHGREKLGDDEEEGGEWRPRPRGRVVVVTATKEIQDTGITKFI